MANGENQISFKKYSVYPSPSEEEKISYFRELIN